MLPTITNYDSKLPVFLVWNCAIPDSDRYHLFQVHFPFEVQTVKTKPCCNSLTATKMLISCQYLLFWCSLLWVNSQFSSKFKGKFALFLCPSPADTLLTNNNTCFILLTLFFFFFLNDPVNWTSFVKINKVVAQNIPLSTWSFETIPFNDENII